jgi:hypothetical protein
MSSPTRSVHFGRLGGMRYQGRFLDRVGGSQLMNTGCEHAGGAQRHVGRAALHEQWLARHGARSLREHE